MWVTQSGMNFEALASEHKDAVYRQLVRVCGNREDAEDALIEALLKAYRNLETLQAVSAFRPWLAQIGRRVCWQFKAREALLPIVQLSAMEEDDIQLAGQLPNAETYAARQQMKEVLHHALSLLPEGEREVYQLREIEELSGEEVARRLGISIAAMKSRLHRARANLRKYIDDALAQPGVSGKN
jgi:RNA polymerase sigma-70 factor, ECF subfamily